MTKCVILDYTRDVNTNNVILAKEVYPVYENLEIELLKNRMQKKVLAHELGIGVSTIYDKFKRKVDWNLTECRKTKHILKTNMSIDELFRWVE